MNECGSSVTLIFYSLDKEWWKREPVLNILAAAAQMSTFTHVEVALGEEAGTSGEMSNVLRVFNDACGVELTHRTGKNPNYCYVSVGCSQNALNAMLRFARNQVGKPFSSTGMARSLIFPRTTDGTQWYCAELTAACLQAGGLMSRDSKPGEATPKSLYRLYKSTGAVQANPCVLRQQFGMRESTGASASVAVANARLALARIQRQQQQAVVARSGGSTRRDSPPRQQFRVIQARGARAIPTSKSVTLTLTSLDMSRS